MSARSKKPKVVEAWAALLPRESIYGALRFHRIFVRESYAREWLHESDGSRIARVEIREVTRKRKPAVSGNETNTKPGWYYYDTDYTDEGSCGPYPTRIAAIRAARHDAEIDVEHVGVFLLDRPPGEAPWPRLKP